MKGTVFFQYLSIPTYTMHSDEEHGVELEDFPAVVTRYRDNLVTEQFIQATFSPDVEEMKC